MTVLLILQTLLLVLLTVLVFGLLRAYATVLQRLHVLEGQSGGPSAGDDRTFTMLPITASSSSASRVDSASRVNVVPIDEDFPAASDIVGTTLAGETAVLRAVDVDYDTVLVFLSSGCSTCAVFWSELAKPLALPPRTRLVAVTQDAANESVVSLRKLAPPEIDVVLSSQAWSDYGVPGSPYVVAVNGTTGRVRGEGTGQSWSQIAELLARATGDAGYLTGGPYSVKPPADARRESDVDRELIEAGLLPGDPRLYGGGQ